MESPISMASNLLSDDLFIAGAGYAKTLARKREESYLSELCFLGGLALAARVQPNLMSAPVLTERMTSIEEVLSSNKFKVPKGTIKPTEEKMPLDEALWYAMKAGRDGIGLFVDRLIMDLSPIKLSRNPFVLQIIPFLSVYMTEDYGIGHWVNAEHFAAAAFTAYEAGVFNESPSISSHFSLNQAYFEAMINQVFNGRRTPQKSPKRERFLQLDDELQMALMDKDNDVESFISALNSGLLTGFRIIFDKSTAYHEAGHAIVSWVLRPEIPVNRILVKRTDDYDGVTQFDGDSPHFNRHSRHDYLVELSILLAGRAAQSIKYGLESIDVGATSDLQRATERAWSSIASHGLDPEFGPIDLSAEFLGPTGWLMDEAQKRLQIVIKEAAARAQTILLENWAHVEIIASELVDKGEVNFEDFIARLAAQGLEGIPGVLIATSVLIERKVEFTSSSGSRPTPEGVVRYEAGDAIVTDTTGESWPVSRSRFNSLYSPAPGVKAGTNGTYQKIKRTVNALRLGEISRIDMQFGRGVLLGKAGDWVVDYGNGDLAIVNAEAFERTYRLEDLP